MSFDNHETVKELHQLAAHAHNAAAAHEKGDHLSAHELTRQAHEHSTRALKHLKQEAEKPLDQGDR